MFKSILSLFKKNNSTPSEKAKPASTIRKGKPRVASTRIGELGEHKINIQLDQLPRECKSLSDLLISNSKSRTGFSQIDHLVISPYCLFVIETKNYNGEIKGNRMDQQWSVSNRFKMYNPLKQNYGHIKAVESLLKEIEDIRYVSMISFTMRCRFSIDPQLRHISSDELVVYDVELSEYIGRKLTRLKQENVEPLLSPEQINMIYERLSNSNITDQNTRNQHVQRIHTNTKGEKGRRT